MAEDSDKKPGKIIKDGQKATQKLHEKEMKELEAQSKDIKRQTEISAINARILDGMAKADKLEAIGQTELAKESREALAELGESLSNNQNANAVKARAADLANIEKMMKVSDSQLAIAAQKEEESNKKIQQEAEREHYKRFHQREKVQKALKERREAREKAAQEENMKGLKGLSERIKSGTEAAKLSDDFIAKAFNDLGPIFAGEVDPIFGELQNEFKNLKELEEKGQVTQEESNEIRQAILDATTDREKEREAQKAAELQAEGFTKLGDAVGGLGEKLGNFGQSAVKTGGLLGGLIALVIGVVDPELLSQIIQKFVTGFLDIVEGLVAFVTGDFEVAKQKIGDNILLFGGLVLGLALYFGGPLITAFGGIFTKLGKVVRAIKVFRTFMLGLFTPTMLSTLGTMLTGLGATLAPLLPIVAVIAVIAGAFMFLKNQLGEGASIMDTLKLGALYLIDGLSMLVNGITFLPRKIFEFLGGGRLARWLFGDEVGDMVDSFLGEGLETGRAGKFKEETKARLAQEKRDKELAEQAEAEGITDLPPGVEIPDVTTGTDLTALGDETSAAQIAAATGGSGTQVMGANITNNTSSQAATTIMAVQPNPSRLALEGVTGR